MCALIPMSIVVIVVGGVPRSVGFGTRGGLTSILSAELERSHAAGALKARRTFATTGQRLVGLVRTRSGAGIQGDEVEHPANLPEELGYRFRSDRGSSSIEAFDASGRIWQRDLWSGSDKTPTILRWAGHENTRTVCILADSF